MKKLIAILSFCIVLLLLPNVNINAKIKKPKLKETDITVYLSDYSDIEVNSLLKNFKKSSMKISLEIIDSYIVDIEYDGNYAYIIPIISGNTNIKVIVYNKKNNKKLYTGKLHITIKKDPSEPDIPLEGPFSYIKDEYIDENDNHHVIEEYYHDGMYVCERHLINDKPYSSKSYKEISYYDENYNIYLTKVTKNYVYLTCWYISQYHSQSEPVLGLIKDYLKLDEFKKITHELHYTYNDNHQVIKAEVYYKNKCIMTADYKYNEDGSSLLTTWTGINGKSWVFVDDSMTPIEKH